MSITKRQADVIAWTSMEGQGHSHRQAALPEVDAVCCDGNWDAEDRAKKEHKKKPGFPDLYVRCQVLITVTSAAINQTET